MSGGVGPEGHLFCIFNSMRCREDGGSDGPVQGLKSCQILSFHKRNFESSAVKYAAQREDRTLNDGGSSVI